MNPPAFRRATVRVRVPATSANLGPGFDALGLALDLVDELSARVLDAGLAIEVAGEGERLPRDEGHLVVRAMRATFDPYAGPPQLIFAFEAAVIGGAGSLWGTLLGGIVLGLAQSIGAQIIPQGFLIAGHGAFLVVLLARLYRGEFRLRRRTAA